MKLIRTMRNFLRNISKAAKITEEVNEGIKNQSATMNRKFLELIENIKQQNELMNIQIDLLLQGFSHLAKDFQYQKFSRVNDGIQMSPNQRFKRVNDGFKVSPNFEKALQQHPLLFAPKTYNTSHPDYDATLARNFPGKVFNKDKNTTNPLYNELKKMILKDEISEERWANILKETLEEAKTVPHADEMFQRKAFVEDYLMELEIQYGGFYRPGWVNLDDALFLYWVVRHLKPKVIVQTGVCNGLSSAFMMLALVKNGPDGTLHVIDMPPVFDSNDPNWKIPGKVYGVVIPEGKTSGWLVPDAYQNRFEVQKGDAKLLLPGMLKKLGKIDMFYHDSDHTYDHMMFEFKEAKNYLAHHGVIVSDDISWNASLWDFADEYLVPAYNYRGSMGLACF